MVNPEKEYWTYCYSRIAAEASVYELGKGIEQMKPQMATNATFGTTTVAMAMIVTFQIMKVLLI